MVPDKQFIERVKREILYGREISAPRVDTDKCQGCGLCVQICPLLVFELRDSKSYVKYGEHCFACGQCWAICPNEAVVQHEVTTDTTLRPGNTPAVSPDDLQLLIRERRSSRLFAEKPVPRELIQKMIEAGRYAPTASNRQDVNYIVLPNAERVAELRALIESFMDRTTKAIQNKIIAAYYSLRFGRDAMEILNFSTMAYEFIKKCKGKNVYSLFPFGSAVLLVHAQSFDTLAQVNCSIALYTCALMAHSLGLGSCFMGYVQIGANMDKATKRWLNLPKGNKVYGAMVIGYPDVKYHRLVERTRPDVRWY